MIGKLSTRMRVILVASLALNLFVIGAVAADAIAGSGWLAGTIGLEHRPPRLTGMPNPRELREVLPEQGRAVLEATLGNRGPQFRESLRAMLAARRAAADAIRAKPFDRAKVEQAFAALREREAALAAVAQGTILELVAQLDAEGRDKVAGLLDRHIRREPER